MDIQNERNSTLNPQRQDNQEFVLVLYSLIVQIIRANWCTVKTLRSIRDASEKVSWRRKEHLAKKKKCNNVTCRIKHISPFPVCGYQMIKHSLLTSAILNTGVIQRTDTNHRTIKQLFLTHSLPAI